MRTPVAYAQTALNKLAGNAAHDVLPLMRFPSRAVSRVKAMLDEGEDYIPKGTVRPLPVLLISRVTPKEVCT